MDFLGSEIVWKCAFLAVVAVVAALAARLLSRMLRRMLDASRVPSASIFVNLAKGVVWAFALLAVLQPVFGVQPTAFVTALGVSSVVISFGLQDTVSNVVGGLNLMVSKAVVPDDVVSVNGVSGVVTDVNWRATVVRTRGGTTVVIPNSVLNKNAVTKLVPWDASDCAVKLVVRADADLAEVERTIRSKAHKALRDVLVPGHTVEVYFTELTSMGIRCTVHLHVKGGIGLDAQRDKLVRALAGSSWLASATLALEEE